MLSMQSADYAKLYVFQHQQGQAASLNCCTPPEEGAAAAAGTGVGSGFGGVGAELSPVSTSMRTEPTLTVSCTCSALFVQCFSIRHDISLSSCFGENI